MLEKAVRAIIDLDGRHGLAYTEAAAERLALRYARAVLLAVRVPTDEMAGAFVCAEIHEPVWSDEDECREWYGDRVNFGSSWGSAIDTILAEPA